MRKKKTVEKFLPDLLACVIFCPNLNKEVTLKRLELSFSSGEGDCDSCGSHGSVLLTVHSCICGQMHDIEVSSW